MRKRGALYTLRGLFRQSLLIAALFFCVTLVSADHTATLTVNPLEQYETTLFQHELNVNNYGSQDVITKITASIPQGTFVGAVSYGGWKSSINNSNSTNATLFWYDGTVETNVVSALFQFLLRAGKVNSDTPVTLTLQTRDAIGFTQTQSFIWTIRNDVTGPIFTPITPVSGLLLQSAPPVPLSANASDNETGVRNVSFTWNNCTNASNATGQPSGTIMLSASGSQYSGSVDLSGFGNENRICFTYTAESNGDALTTSTGTITIDGLAPTVSLISPLDGATMNSQTQFRFLPADNLASTIECTMSVDGIAETSGSYPNGQTAEASAADAPEGLHNWQVRCMDTVGLQGSSLSRSYFLDRTPPTITIDHVEGAVLKEGTEVIIITDDNYQLLSTSITIGNTTTNSTNKTVVNTVGLAEGPHAVIVQAMDAAGNTASRTYNYFIDKTAPVLTILAPEDGGSLDVFAGFTFTAIDNYDPSVNCLLSVDGTTANQTNTSGNQTQNLTAMIMPGSHTWQITCADDAENAASSDIRTVTIVDTSGPDVQITPVDTFVRGATVPLSATATDFSGVALTTATITAPDGTVAPVTLTQQGTQYTATIPTTIDNQVGEYVITLQSTDTNGFQTVRTETFALTYAYKFSLTLTPDSTTPGTIVQLLGVLTLDNGNATNDTDVNVTLPGGNTTTNTTNGVFGLTFPAPGDGTYLVIASTVAPNGIEFSGSAVLTVSSPSSGGSSGGGSGGGLTGFGSSNHPGGSASSASSAGDSSAGGQQQAAAESAAPSAVDSGYDAGTEAPMSASTTLSTEQQPTNGVGQAIGFFNLDALKEHRMAWSIAALAILLAVLFILGLKGHFHQNAPDEPDGSDWESYLARLRR